MATLLFVYARSSINAAKRNAQRHREADGGQINWNNENRRRHGLLEPPTAEDQAAGLGQDKTSAGETERERALKERTWNGKRS
jgi:hypothetical protein